ncbi:MAG: UDP-3-O-(3-hydroxymyristoyl)glucosamine N-acyltransferase [Acidobacteriota bacterium]|nr:MAG: UDP-3-O-(3-hydroxymyristoyl)glucosamine N-acyltransferase [Acidobacteriota bacterium]
MKLKDIAEKLNCELRGPGDLEITGVSGVEDAGPDELAFVSNPKYIGRAKVSRAGAIIVGKDTPEVTAPTLVSENPYLTFAQAIELFYAPPVPISGIHPTASIARTAVIGDNASIGANAVIGEGAHIGDRATIYPNVTIYPHAQIGDDFTAHSNSCVREFCQLGHRVILQNGAVIGADGFGFAPRKDRSYYKIVQSGIVVLEDDVEVGANSTVDRATVGETRIARGTKLDNLVQIGHGSTVGEDSVLAAQTGIAGSTHVGNRVMMAGQVGAAGHLTIGDDVIATAQTGIARSVEAGSSISGSPEFETSVWKKNYIIMQSLPELAKEVRKLRKELDELKGSSQ